MAAPTPAALQDEYCNSEGLEIPELAGTVVSSIVVPAGGLLQDVAVLVDISHT